MFDWVTKPLIKLIESYNTLDSKMKYAITFFVVAIPLYILSYPGISAYRIYRQPKEVYRIIHDTITIHIHDTVKLKIDNSKNISQDGKDNTQYNHVKM